MACLRRCSSSTSRPVMPPQAHSPTSLTSCHICRCVYVCVCVCVFIDSTVLPLSALLTIAVCFALLPLCPALQVTAMSFVNLPRAIRESVFFISCSRISSALTGALTGLDQFGEPTGSDRKVNIFGLHSVRLDLEAFQRFAEGAAVPQLAECFAPLAQLLKLLLSHDVEQFTEPAIRSTTYAKVSPHTLILVLEKYRELGAMGLGRRRAAQAGLPIVKRKTVDGLIKKILATDG